MRMDDKELNKLMLLHHDVIQLHPQISVILTREFLYFITRLEDLNAVVPLFAPTLIKRVLISSCPTFQISFIGLEAFGQ